MVSTAPRTARRLAHLSEALLGDASATVGPSPVAAAGPASPAPPRSRAALGEEDLETYEREGVVVIRGFFSENELAAIANPIAELQGAPESPLVTGADGTKFNYPDFQGLRQLPELATASCDHPRVVGAVEQALGDDAELSQFGALTWAPDAGGVGLHYDYKPFRVVGSFLDWMFCIIPLTEYDEHDGPLLVCPRSHCLTTVLPNDDDAALLGANRVHQVDAAQVPPLEMVRDELIDPQLKRGDLLLMKCFTFHFADSNRSPSNGRTGLYMKFRVSPRPLDF